MNLWTQDEALRYLADRIKSREWWVFFACDPADIAVVSRIENQFYSDAAGTDFELIVANLKEVPFASVFLAKKTRLSPEQLATIMRDCPVEFPRGTRLTAAHLRDRDVVSIGKRGCLAAVKFNELLVAAGHKFD